MGRIIDLFDFESRRSMNRGEMGLSDVLSFLVTEATTTRGMMEELDETQDFVIVGSGGGSMCAGLVMRQAGNSVLVLEKTDLLGGSTARAGGVMWIPNNRFMATAGVEDSFDAAALYLDNVVGNDETDAPGATRARRLSYLREAPEMLEFLIAQGIKFHRNSYWPDYRDELAGSSEPGRTVSADPFDLNELGQWKSKLRPNKFTLPVPLHQAMDLPLIKVSWKARFQALRVVFRGLANKLSGKDLGIAGAALQGRMLQAAVRAGVELRTHSPVKEILMVGDRVIGVLTEKDGKPWRVGARLGVLLNAGGFAHNQEMRDQYIPHTRAEWTHAAPGDTGDMHRELMRIGAWMAQMNEMVGNQMTIPPEAVEAVMIQPQIAKPHAILVDQTGVRYMNEGGSYMSFCQGMLKRHETVPAVPSWWIMDDRFMKRYMFAETMPGSKKPREWFDSGYMKKADTIEGLAIACDIKPAALKTTIDKFNRFARAGKDQEFGRGDRAYDRYLGDYTHKPSATLGPIETGPFYAVQVVPGDVGTFGGAVCDDQARVLREDGSVIPGLYATGTTTASVMGRSYPGAGCSIGPSFTWGFVAAKHAARVNSSASV